MNREQMNKRLEIKLKHKERMKELANQEKQIEADAFKNVKELEQLMLAKSHILKFQPVNKIVAKNYKHIIIRYKNPSKKFNRNKKKTNDGLIEKSTK